MRLPDAPPQANAQPGRRLRIGDGTTAPYRRTRFRSRGHVATHPEWQQAQFRGYDRPTASPETPEYDAPELEFINRNSARHARAV